MFNFHKKNQTLDFKYILISIEYFIKIDFHFSIFKRHGEVNNSISIYAFPLFDSSNPQPIVLKRAIYVSYVLERGL